MKVYLVILCFAACFFALLDNLYKLEKALTENQKIAIEINLLKSKINKQ